MPATFSSLLEAMRRWRPVDVIIAKASHRPDRIIEFDLLRGAFMVMIIVDHLQFWPNIFRYATGEGRLWVTAAEGFFIISGLLIGYIRAYKGQKYSLKHLTKLLLKRAGMLYLWGMIVTVILTVPLVLLPPHDIFPRLPAPSPLINPLAYIWNVLTMQDFNPWIYFLRMYAIMLVFSPVFLWLVRKKQWIIIATGIVALYLIGWKINEPAFLWSPLFFGAAIIGFFLRPIITFLQKHTVVRRVSAISIILITALSMLLSFFFVHGWDKVENPDWTLMDRDTYVAIRTHIDPIFTNDPLTIQTIILAFIWFGGLFTVFHYLRKPLAALLGWLLLSFGQRSLTAYCIHGIVLISIVAFIQPSTNILINSAIAAGVVLMVWALINIPLVQKILPR